MKKFKLFRLLALFVVLITSINNAWAANFANGEVIFIYANESSAWNSSACVKAWFHNSGDNAVATNWLFDKGKEKMFYCVVPSSGSYSECQLQRFASNCSTWWNSNGDILASNRTSGYNTFYTNGDGTANCGWKGTYSMYLKGSTDDWASNLATFTFSSGTTFTASYVFTAEETSYEFKMCDSYGNWHGDNVEVSGLVVGATYRFTGTINLASGIGSLSMSKTQLTFAIATSATNGSVSPTSAFVGSSGVEFTATPSTGYHWSSWGTTSGLSATNANPTSLTATAAGTLTANFAANNYTASNNIKHADGNTAGQYNVNYDATSISYTTTPSKTGYNLEGLYYENTLTNKIVNNDRSLRASTSYTTSGSKWNQTSAPNLYAKWTAKTYTETNNIKDEDGTTSKGTYTATYDATSITINTTPTKSGYHVEGYYISTTFTSGNKVADATGALEASVSGFTDASRHWIKDAKVNLYVHWEENAASYTLTFGVADDPYDDGTLAVTAGGAAASSGSSYTASTSIACTATPGTHSRVKGWYSDDDCESAIGGAGTGNTYNFSLGANTSVYVGFEDATTTITLNKNGGDAGASSTSVTHGDALSSFTAHTRAGYTLKGYYTAESAGTKVINADGTLVAGTSYATSAPAKWNVKDRTLTLYAQWTEKTVTLTPTLNSIGTAASYSVTANSSSSASVGIDTEVELVASSATTGYSFTGWVLSSNLTTDDELTSTTITVKTNGDGEAVSAQAVYAEVLTSNWHLVGLNETGYEIFPDGWNISDESMMQKKTGYSSASVVYMNITVTSTKTYYFKIVDDNDGGGAIWFGYSTGDTYREWTETDTKEVYSGSGNSNNLKFTPDFAGTYEFKVDYSGDYPAVTITYPEVYAVVGSFNSWNAATNPFEFVGNDGTADITITGSADDYTFKIVDHNHWRGYASSGKKITGTEKNIAIYTGGDGNNIALTADIYPNGSYTFEYDKSDHTLDVTYPTAYTVNYSAVTISTGGGDGKSGETSASPSFPTGKKVLSGTSVTFTAQAAKSGYTWRGWFTKNNPSNWTDGKVSTDDNLTYTVTINAAKTLYAIYSEDTYSVSVATDGTTGSSVSTSSVSNIGIATKSGDITANAPNLAWRFKNWTLPDGVTAADGYNANSNPIQIHASAGSKTIIANFEPRYGLIGSRNGDGDAEQGMPGWTNGSAADFSVVSFTKIDTDDGVDLECTRTLEPNRQYKFMVYDREADTRRGCKSETNENDAQVLPAGSNWQLDGTYQVLINTAGYGSYTFHITKMGASSTYYPSLQVDRPSSHELTLGRKVIFNESNATLTDATNTDGGTVSATTNENEGYGITSGQFFADGSNIVFTATPATGYQVEGWYSDATCETAYTAGTNVSISGDKKTLTLSSLEDNVTVYVKFEEIMTTVSLQVYLGAYGGGSITINDEPAPATINVGVHTKYTVKAVPDRGYYFEGWALSPATPDFAITGTPADDTNDHPEVSGLGGGETSGQVLEANFHDLDKIYFKNWDETANDGAGGPLWDVEHVYVHFNVGWANDGDYAGVNNLGTHAEMTLNSYIGDNVFEAYVPHSFTKSGNGKVAFFDSWMGTAPYEEGKTAWGKSCGGKGVYRTDYNKALNMFVPEHTSMDSKNGTTYYSNGYWKNEYISTSKSGYYLKRRKGTNSYWQMGEFHGEESGRDKNLIFSLRVDNTSADSCKYRIVSAGGENYVSASTITNANHSDIQLNVNNTDDSYFTITPTVEGDYLITITQTAEKMKISVNYPVAVGDYRLKHSYNDGSAKVSYSDIIKLRNAADDTVSMFIYAVDGPDAGTEIDGSLVLQRCTDVTDGKPTWSAGNAVSDYTIAKFKDGAGVYKFAIAINTTSHAVTSAKEIGLYTGKYYIKTDGANGGWVRYKVDEDNIMHKNEINFDPEDVSSFNYYFCHYYAAGRAEVEAKTYDKATNIKCVIANDYNNAVSDTLVGDDILGTYEKGGKTYPQETLPYAGSVRFSYNSLTNEVKRTYLNGSSYGVSFLYLVTDDEEMIYTGAVESEETDVHEIAEGSCKFSDDQNWIYERIVYAYPTATAGVKTEYDGHKQTLIATDHLLIGGAEKGEQKYMMKLVYDFKTNYIMSAYTPSGAITTDIDDVDVLLVRHAQDAATTITFSGGSLDAQKVIGAIRFNRAEMQGNVGTWNEDTRPYLKYFISFPFDVRVRDIFGINSNYGDAYVVSRYAGEKRAEKGFFRGDGTTTFWEELTIDSVMHANQGYVVILDNDYFNGTVGDLWAYNPTDIYMYFPSTTTIGAITPNETIPVTVPQHECKINRKFTDSYTKRELNHKFTDTDWNLMGVPVFTTITGNKDGLTYDPGKLFVLTELDTTKAIQYFYKWDYDNEFDIVAAHGYTFKPMHSYMVQYHGSVTFVGTAPTPPASVAAHRTPEVKKNYQIELQALDMNEKLINRTYVELRENACDTFELNEDVYMSPTNRAINIYTFAGNYDVAANVLSVGNHIVPVGFDVRKAGTFTFTMPSNFDGTVTLIDTYTGTRTNLALGDYTVNLPKGYNSDRFELEINIKNAPTAIDGVSGGSLKDGNAHKYIENGVMYILEKGRIFDARGNRVK